MTEIEAIAKKYDFWDNSKSPYAFLVGYENDTQPGVVNKFLTKRMKGGNAFRECVQKMLNSFNPDVIVVEEFTGIKGNQLNNYPTRVRVTDEKKAQQYGMEVKQQAFSAQAVVDNVFDGLGGIEGFEGIKNGIGALLTVERERHTKDMMIDRLTWEHKFRDMENAQKMERLSDTIEQLKSNNKALEERLAKANNQIAELEDENETLVEENDKYKPNKMIKDVGISALTNVAMQLSTKSPVLRGLLGIEDEPTKDTTPTPQQPVGSVGVQMDESNLTEGQRIALKTINDIAQALTTWPIPHLERFIKMMAFVEDNEERQLEMMEYITEQIEDGN